MAGEVNADDVWRDLVSFVFDHRDGWKRAVIERSGLPFSRIRILNRLRRTPMSVKQLAEAAMIDAPAATVAVNDLEERGLVARRVDPDNRRTKVVSLTDAGRAAAAEVAAVGDPAPAALAALPDDQLVALRRILDELGRS